MIWIRISIYTHRESESMMVCACMCVCVCVCVHTHTVSLVFSCHGRYDLPEMELQDPTLLLVDGCIESIVSLRLANTHTHTHTHTQPRFQAFPVTLFYLRALIVRGRDTLTRFHKSFPPRTASQLTLAIKNGVTGKAWNRGYTHTHTLYPSGGKGPPIPPPSPPLPTRSGSNIIPPPPPPL